MTNYELIKSMDIKELAIMLTEFFCKTFCGENLEECEQEGCSWHRSNDYQTYYQWLQEKAED